MGAEPVEPSLTMRQPLVPARVLSRRVARRITADGGAAGRGGRTEAPLDDEAGGDVDDDGGAGMVTVVVPVGVDDGMFAARTRWLPGGRTAISALADNITNAPMAAVSGRTPFSQPQRTILNDTRHEAYRKVASLW